MTLGNYKAKVLSCCFTTAWSTK